VLVLGRGDSELLRLDGLQARHFPRGADGRYLGHHPADDEEAIALLEAERASGAEYLAIPAAEGWWIEHYADFAAHLAACSRAEAHAACTIYTLEPVRAEVEARQ
jgi:hypothetical protein